jgi:LuxR family transcriptional regulator, maltose regulon positive regulatory protein
MGRLALTGQREEVAILEGKLYPATGTRRPLPRPRLDSLSDVLEGEYPVVLVVAPAGYGKSTLMARWHAQLLERHVPCAWLSLDPEDDDKVRFMRHLVAALHAADARVGPSVGANLSADFPGGTKTLLEALAYELARLEQRVVLFVDDLHFVQSPEVLEILDWLVNYAPRTLQQVIGTREKPSLRLGGPRVRRQLLELDLLQLRFDLAETAQFYSNRLGQDLPKRDLERLLAKTEGWPAALELVALALSGLKDRGEFIEHFAGTDSSLVEYLGEVLLSQLDDQTRSFVFRISMFDRISASLAQALGEADAEERLDGMRLRNLFLIPLDRSGNWSRFHHLVGEFFRERYRRTEPAQALECLHRGAGWLHANGYIEEAVNCMIRAQDWERATRWVAESVEELVFRRGYHQTILRWMNALPEAQIDRYPAIRIQYAFALAFYPRHRQYEAQMHRLQQMLQSRDSQQPCDAQAISEVRCAVELLTAMSAGLRDEGKRGGELAAAWLATWPNESLRRKGVMGNVLAFGHNAAGQISRGLDVITDTRRWLEQSEGYYALAWTGYLEGVLRLKGGDYVQARLACHSALELVERELLGHPGQACMLHALLGGIAYEFDEITSAVEHVERAMGSISECSHADAMIIAYLTQARLQRLRGDDGSAVAMLREGQDLGQRRALPRVTFSLAAEECSELARSGRNEEARVIAARFGFSELPTTGGLSGLPSDKALRAASRYLLRQSPGLVIEALDGAIESSQRRGLAHRTVELLLIRARAYKQRGEVANALTDLNRALTLAAPRQYLRVFLDEGPELGSLVDALDVERLGSSPAIPLARRLQQARKPGVQGPSTGPTLGELLTRREVAILKRLESGLSNKEIAEAIFLSEGTLKWHLHNVYSKLNVKNRSGAMARARTLGIV